MNVDLQKRLENKTDHNHPSGCWIWLGAKSGRNEKYKHGSISVGGRKTELVSRVAWRLYRHDIPEGMQVLHRCDNPLCVNPEHLFLGTHADNMADMQSKGRSTAGEKSAKTRLSTADVIFIRECDQSHLEMARRFGVAHSTIVYIRQGRAWKNLPLPKGIIYQRAPRSQSEAMKEKLRAYWRLRRKQLKEFQNG